MHTVEGARTSATVGPSANALAGDWKLEQISLEVFEKKLSLARRFYLIGRAYAEGARSLRHAAQLLKRGRVAGPLDQAVLDGLGVHEGTVNRCVAKMEALVEKHFGLPRVALVVHQGEGFAFGALTPEGRIVWEKVKEFLERYWHREALRQE